jgi:hypothetical protein
MQVLTAPLRACIENKFPFSDTYHITLYAFVCRDFRLFFYLFCYKSMYFLMNSIFSTDVSCSDAARIELRVLEAIAEADPDDKSYV